MRSKFSLIVSLFLWASVITAQDYKVLSSDKTSILIEYHPKLIRNATETINSQNYIDLQIDNGIYDDFRPGDAAVPHRAFNIGVPEDNGNTIQILRSDYIVQKGKLKPYPKLVKRKGIFTEEPVGEYSSDEISHQLVEFGEFGFARDLPVQTIKVYPIQFDRNNSEVKIYTRIVFRVNFSPKSRTMETNKIYSKDLPHYDKLVLNFNIAKAWLKAGRKSLAKKAAHSLLSSGTWYKFDLTEEGIYKINQSDLSKFGIDASVDPRTIKIYNYGGYELPQNPGDAHFDDMHEIAIYVSGESDGKFDSGDYILFYGRGVDFVEYDNINNKLVRNKNHYSQKNTYFITSGNGQGLRIREKVSSNEANAYSQTTTKAFQFKEDDVINIIKSGITYLGDEFNSSNNSRTYVTPLSYRVGTTPVDYSVNFVNNSDNQQTLEIYESNNLLYTRVLLGASGYSVASSKLAQFTFGGSLDNDRSSLKIIFKANNVAAKGYLDYIEYRYDAYLKAMDDELQFFSKDTNSAINYTLSEFSNSSIWCFDVTEFDNAKLIKPTVVSGGQFKFQMVEHRDSVRKYWAVTENKFKSVGNAVKVENSDLHGLPGAEYLIVTVKDFADQAQKLADYRENGSWEKLSTQVVFMDNIYNEYSSGLKDPTGLRNFLKYAYYSWDTRPFYVLFFGDGDYDYYNVEGLNLNFIPTFQTVNSFDEVYSYPTDDYFGRVAGDDKRLDFAMGRLNVQSSGDAEVMVGKIMEYEIESEKGLWRNRITLVADDGLTSQGNDGNIHTAQSETLAKAHIPAYFDLNKLYLSAFPTVSTGLGRRKPQVNEGIVNAVNNGTLILNFIGHGNPEVWAHEVVFEKTVTIQQFKNENYFFLTAATCDFGLYDDPTDQSGTEELVLKYKSGAIGGISAARPVYSNSNAALAYLFYDYLLPYRDSLYLPRTIGEAYYLLKQSRTNTNDEKFHLFGDPALRLNIPHYNVTIDSINGVANGTGVQLKALSEANIKGSVVDRNGDVLNSINGEAIISVYDSQREQHLDDINYDMTLQGGLIFRGRTTVENGRFATSFTVPKDISYENKNGKIVVYLLSDQDGVGFNNDFIVGGTDSSVANDGKGPELEIYFDNLDFENSYLVNPDFTLLVKLSDKTGLNTTGTGVGHKLEGILNDDNENPIDLTDYFIGDLNAGGKSGLIKYKFTDLDEGEYKIKIKAWDVFNNFSQAEDYFSVVSGSGLEIRDVYNYPNPFTTNTYFTFQHNLVQPVNVKIKIYTIAGRLINEIEENNILEKFVKIPWDGRDKDGNTIANGTYLYKLIVKSSDGSVSQNFLGKIAIIR